MYSLEDYIKILSAQIHLKKYDNASITIAYIKTKLAKLEELIEEDKNENNK